MRWIFRGGPSAATLVIVASRSHPPSGRTVPIGGRGLLSQKAASDCDRHAGSLSL
ncbi:hypothetical protein PF011_g8508 [Phytophthora fragariae]|uniref:Uncharacterized protein n=1 Tax=Phytophthora fragariae TaxID=53985 RepID=A0A6A3LBE7_9STRA|nr:hypothetical protein PF011_g8508 [Phytophthora fragariae]